MSWGDYDEENKPIVKEDEDGNLVLDDPTARGMIEAVSKHNCEQTYYAQLDRVIYFKHRLLTRGDDPNDVCIVLLNVDDPNGGPIAEILMPGHDWQSYRDRGEIPFARGLAGRQGLQDIVSTFDVQAAVKLSELPGKICCLVVDHGAAVVMEVQ